MIGSGSTNVIIDQFTPGYHSVSVDSGIPYTWDFWIAGFKNDRDFPFALFQGDYFLDVYPVNFGFGNWQIFFSSYADSSRPPPLFYRIYYYYKVVL